MTLPKVETPSDGWSFHVTPWERTFLQKVKSAKRIIRLACPFIKLRNIRLILSALAPTRESPLRIELLTRLNVRDCRSCVHDLSALRLLLENPLGLQCSVEVRVDNLLHAKLYIFDDSEAIVTSSNLTYAGFNRNLEVALATSLPTPVQATISHFQSLFRNAIPLTQAALEEVASLVRTLPSASIDLLQPEGPGGRAEELDEFPFDPNAIEQIDTALEKQLAKEVQDSLLSIETVGVDAVDAEGLLETRFYEEMQSRYLGLFGAAVPTEHDLATIYFHRSAYGRATAASPDADRAEKLEDLGKHAFMAAIALTFVGSSPTATGETISTKVEYISTSNHLVRKLNDLGLSHAILGRGLKHYNDAKHRGVGRVARQAAHRVVGYLYQRLDWAKFVEHLLAILQLDQEFPYESYRHENVKQRLQEKSQELYGAGPRYEVTKRDGPDDDVTFTVAVVVRKKGIRFLAEGKGPNKKAAETDAAYNALLALGSAEDHLAFQHKSEPLPSWVADRCRTEGRDLLKSLTGFVISEQFTEAILVPYGHHDVEAKALRSCLAAVGGSVRALLVKTMCFARSSTFHDAMLMASQINTIARVVHKAQSSPLGAWLKRMRSDNAFQGATAAGPMIDTVNAIFGAVCIQHQIEQCGQFFKLVIPAMTEIDVTELIPARSKLQQKLQTVLKDRYTHLFRLESRTLSKPDEANDPRVEVILRLGDREIGRGVARRKKKAAENASRNALDNPQLQEIISAEEGKTMAGESAE